MSFDDRQFRDALGRFPTGVCIVTARGEAGSWVGMTVSSFNSVSLDPPIILWSLRCQSRLRALFHDAPGFVINILADDGEALAKRFASPDPRPLGDIETDSAGPLGERLPQALVSLDCKRHDVIEAGDHDVLLGRVVGLNAWRDAGSLGFAGGQFCAIDPSRPSDVAAGAA